MHSLVNVYIHVCLSVCLCPRVINRPWIKDRFMSPDIEAAHRLIIDQKASAESWGVKAIWTKSPGLCIRDLRNDLFFFNLPQVWQVAKPYIEKYETEYIPESRPVSPTAFSLEPPASPRKRVRLEWNLTLKTVWIMLIKMFICFFRWTVL